MRRIFKSYLKLFLTSWLETLGTLLFLVTFIVVILSMLPAPLQISLMANKTNKQTNQWDHTVQIDANYVADSRIMKEQVNAFSSDFIKEITRNFLEGRVVAKEADVIKDEKKIREAINNGDVYLYELISASGSKRNITFMKLETSESNNNVKNNVIHSESLFTEWFDNSINAINEILVELDAPILNAEKWSEMKLKYNADIFNYAAYMFYLWSHNEKTMITDIKSIYKEIISNAVGYSFEFDPSWNEGERKNIADRFDNAVDQVKLSDMYKQEVLDYYYLDAKPNSAYDINEPTEIKMYRDIWNAIQTNVFDQLNIKYTRENTIYTIANIGNNKNQAVNFTEIYDQNIEVNRINNLVWDDNGYAAGGTNLNEMNVFGNDKFLNSISKYDNKFKVNGLDVRLQNTQVGYKLNGITSKNDWYNYSIFDSKPEYTGELYVRQDTFNELYKRLNVKMDNEHKIPGTNYNYLRMTTTFYLSLGNDNEEMMSLLLGNVSGTNQNIFVIDTAKIYSKNQSPQLKMITMVNLMTIIYSVIGMILLLLASVFMLYSQKEELNKTRKQLGVFKSNGYKTWELSLPSTLKVFLLMFVGLLVGYLLSFPLQMNAVDKQFGSIVIFEIDRIYANPVFLLILLLIVPGLFTFIIFLILLKFLSEKPLDLMKPSAVANYIKHPWWYWVIIPISFPFILIHKGINKAIGKTRFGFTFKLQAAFLSISKGKFAIVMMLFSFATFLVAMEMKAMPVMNNMFNEATAYLKSDTDHESYIYGDEIKSTDENNGDDGNLIEMSDSNFIGRKFIDLNGSTVNQFLDEQKNLDIKDENRVLDDTVFNTNYLVNRMFEERIEFINEMENNPIISNNEDLKDKILKASSVFAAATLVIPLDLANDESIVILKKLISEMREDFVETMPITDKEINEFINKWINNFKDKICGSENQCGESLLTSKLSDSLKQIEKVKAINSNDIFKIVWMLISSTLKVDEINIAKLDNIDDIKNYIAKVTNSKLPSVRDDSNEEESYDDIIKWFREKIKEIIEFISIEENVEIIENAITNSNLIQYLLQPLLLTDKGIDPLITTNSLVFDSKKETLVRHENIRIEGHNYPTTMMSFDSSGTFGDLKNQYLFDGIWNFGDLGKKNNDGSINVIISKPVAKIQGLSTGDKIKIYDKNGAPEQTPIIGRVMGVQVRNIAVHMIFADYNKLIEAKTNEDSELREHKYTFTDKNDNTEYTYENVYAFNKVISSKKKINLKTDEIELNISKLMDQFSFAQDSYSYMTHAKKQKDVNWFVSMIAGSNYLSNKLIEIDSPFKDSISSDSFFDNVPKTSDIMYSYAVIKAGVATMIKLITNMMIVNIVISLILLLILFTVLIKIIISDASGIIILMRSLGYKDIQINWIVIGKYLTSSIWAFVIMYTISYFTWGLISEFAWSKYTIILAIPIYWYLPFVIFLVMESVITLGFLFGAYRLKKLPLARI